MSIEGLSRYPSDYSAEMTVNRLRAAVEARNMTVFAHVDHAAGAAEAGLELRPTDLLIFGNARGGTPLMQAVQTIGIDLPLKALVWQDEDGRVWLATNDVAWLAARHNAPPATRRIVSAMAEQLQAIALDATTEGGGAEASRDQQGHAP